MSVPIAAGGEGPRWHQGARARHRRAAAAGSRREGPGMAGRARPYHSLRPERTGQDRGVAVSEHSPPSAYPASKPVIPPQAAADLANRQGPCPRKAPARTRQGLRSGRARPELLGDQLGDLRRVERRSLAQVVTADEELDR